MQELVNALRENGYNYTPQEPGVIERFPTDKDKHGAKSGWLIWYRNLTKQGQEFFVARFSDYRNNKVIEFQSDVDLSPKEKKSFDEEIKKAEEKVREERKRIHEKTALEASEIFENAVENPNSDYLAKKSLGGELFGARTIMNHQGRALVVPARDVTGKLWSVQTISADGFKQFLKGGKKLGAYHAIPSREAMENAPEIYLCEGFATGASIYKAIGKPVVVCFDTSNLEKVGREIAKANPDSALIFCADDDGEVAKNDGTYWNPGIETGKKAADAVGGQLIYPKFKIKGDQSDFNDLHCSEGLESVHSCITGIEIKKPSKLRFLGYKSDTYYFTSSERKFILTLAPSAMGNHLNLCKMIGRPYWEKIAPKQPSQNSMETVDWKVAGEKLLAGSHIMGVFNEKKVRASGVWKEPDGRIVINSGEQLWIDGKVFDFEEIESDYIYTYTENDCELPTKEAATSEQMQKIAQLLEQLPWKEKHYAYFLMGWIFIAPICGILPWRPHLWMTAPKGAGKSWIQENIVAKLTRNNTAYLGGTTEAGLRQSLASSAIPVIYDEAEKNDEESRRKMQRVIELFRLASAETNARTVKGTPTGNSLEYVMKFMGIMSSINVSLELSQDISRFTQIELEIRRDDGFEGRGGLRQQVSDYITDDLGKQVYARAVEKRDVLFQNIKTVQKAINSMGKGSRFTDQMAPLIAGYLTAIEDEPVSLDFVEKFTIPTLFKGLGEEAEETAEGNSEEDCLLKLTTSSFNRRGESHTFGSEIRAAYEMLSGKRVTLDFNYDDQKTDEKQQTLIDHGMKIERSREDEFYLAIQTKNEQLRQLFFDSEWAGSWGKTLRRIPGAIHKKARTSFNGKSRVVVKVPINKVLDV